MKQSDQEKIQITAEIKVCYDQLEATAARFPRSVARKTLGALFLAMLDEEISMLQENPLIASVALNELNNIHDVIDKLLENAPVLLDRLEKQQKEKDEKKNSKVILDSKAEAPKTT